MAVAHAEEQPVELTYANLESFLSKQNQTLSGSKQLTQAAEAKTGHLGRSYLPTLKLHAGGEIFQTGIYSPQTNPYGAIEASINVFRGGRDLLEDKARYAGFAASQASETKTWIHELSAARKLFWTLIHNREMIELIEKAQKKNQDLLASAVRRIQRGVGTETDRLEFGIHASQLKEDLESLTHGDLLIEMELSALLGFDSRQKFSTLGTIAHEHDETILSASFDESRNAALRGLQAQKDIAAIQGEQWGRAWLPSVDVYAGYSLYTFRDRDYLSMADRYDAVVGIRLSMDLFDGLVSRSTASSFNIQALGLEQQEQQQRREKRASVHLKKEDLKHDHELIHSSEERIKDTEKYFARILDEYGRGVKNSLDVLSAHQKQLGFQKEYADRKRSYQLTKMELLALLGQ